ncbi:MAG TPA: PadR family transcriptional regulator [Dongiaceae bacterium]|nr:PadR family transcriptional regulator [Dongiaceae bacterium]
MSRTRKARLSTADLVLLSLLAENPLHGYGANAELERRDVHDWANLSRPQVYYSLEKMARAGLLKRKDAGGQAAGPERQVYAVSAQGIRALADALEDREWCVQRDKPPFLTWLALSWQARKGVCEEQVARRREFLRGELRRERKTLASIRREVGHEHHEAVWMVKLMIAQFVTELRWLGKLERELRLRAPARNPGRD